MSATSTPTRTARSGGLVAQLRSELLRFRSRRAVVWLLVAGVVFTLGTAALTVYENRPLSDAERAEVAAQVDAEVERCEQNPRRFVGGNNPDRCAQVIDENWFGTRYVSPFGQLSSDLPLALMGVLAFAVALACTSYVGAEFSSGSLSTTLLFQPDRRVVWLAKVVAAGVWTALVAAATLAVALALLAVVSQTRAGADPSSEQVLDLAGRGLRVLLVVVAVAVVSVAITTAIRSTIGTIGLTVGYLLVGEAALRAISTSTFEPYLVSTRVAAFVQPGITVYREGELTVGPGELVDSSLYISGYAGATYLGIGVLAILLICAVVFQRRDVG